MATSRILALSLLLCVAMASAREVATPAACQAAGKAAPIADARAALAREPDELKLAFSLADAWSEAGCFNEALQVLSSAREAHPESKELTTRLRVAHSVVGEEHFFENLDRAEDQARLKRDVFRCNALSDLDACSDAVKLHPNDAEMLSAQADALLHAGRATDALATYRHAAALAPEHSDLAAKIAAARARVPVAVAADAPAVVVAPPKMRLAQTQMVRATRHFSNLEPETQSH